MFTDDIEKELEWQRTEHALSRPVDVEALFAVCEKLQVKLEEVRESLTDLKKTLRDTVNDLDSIVANIKEVAK